MSDVLLAKKWENEDPTGWWISEKLDGVRAVWRNGEFCSRGDNTFACPGWFKSKMPAGCVLDGELWGGRGQFQKTVGITRSSSRHEEWKFLTYMVFDCLHEGGTSIEHKPFETRLEAIKRICATVDQNEAALKAVPMERCANRDSLAAALADVEKRGGEGLMLRCPGSKYERRRSKTLLKVKTFYDEEAIVVGHAGGTGRVAGWCGALLCETPDKRRFKVGSGLSDAQRQDPPVINAVITYRYQELTADNIPRFPTLVGERTDMTWSQICATYVPPRARKDTALKKTHSILFDDEKKEEKERRERRGKAPSAARASAPSGGPPAPALKRGLSVIDAMQRGTAEEDLDDFGFEDMMPPVPPPEKKPRLSSSEVAATLQTASTKSMCPFGRRCYRKNPMHFLEFQHPWRDEENEPEAPAVAAEPARTTEACPYSTSFAEASAGLFDAETQILPDRVRQAKAAPAEAAGSADPDLRLVALRNLLKSMTEDAASPEIRDHLQRMMDLADSVPAIVKPKEALATHPRSLASALLSTTTSEALGAEPREQEGEAGPEARLEMLEVAKPPEPADPKAHLAAELANMGFAQLAIQEALVHCSTADDAIDWLLAQDQ